jgi:hypothetical protein
MTGEIIAFPDDEISATRRRFLSGGGGGSSRPHRSRRHPSGRGTNRSGYRADRRGIPLALDGLRDAREGG